MGDVNSQEEVYKITLNWLDKQAECREITNLERLIKILLKQRYEEISIIKETMWRQRAKHQWIKEGDNILPIFTK
jgi:hypothetical protein